MNEIVVWQPIALRLFLTVVAGVLVGFNRGEHGEPAGLRTTLLVGLAASIAMLQANLLLGTAGRSPDSYVILDLMRLPLSILTGVTFIGAGAPPIHQQNIYCVDLFRKYFKRGGTNGSFGRWRCMV